MFIFKNKRLVPGNYGKDCKTGRNAMMCDECDFLLCCVEKTDCKICDIAYCPRKKPVKKEHSIF